MKARLVLSLWIASLVGGVGCTRSPGKDLPDSQLLGSARGYRMVRVITHFHTPYSFDACDKNGLTNGKPNPECLLHLRSALCSDRVDFIFLSDHPDHMGEYGFQELLLDSDSGDRLSMKNGSPIANEMAGCGDFRPVITAGFEGKILGLGMENHLSAATTDELKGFYSGSSAELKDRLHSEANAIVIMPHTESRSLADIQALQPDGIEIYNFHANVDPKIRKTYLHKPPFQQIPGILTFLVDPYGSLNADYAFVNFLDVDPIYGRMWSQLLASGLKVMGTIGTDSHENVFPQKASDKERLDSHRRIIRVASNHLLVQTATLSEVKTALKAGRGWATFEGFGSPVGMDFYATSGGTTIGVGETGSFSGGLAHFVVKLPSVYPNSDYTKEKPRVTIRLKQVNADGTDTVVAQATDTDLEFDATTKGIFRAELTIVPKHLRDLLTSFSEKADSEYPWINTNPIFLE